MSQALSEVKVEVGSGPLGRAVYAQERIEEGEVVLSAWGPYVERSAHSIQVAPDRHVHVASDMEFLNHSCDPNCGVLIPLEEEVIRVVALRAIEDGEELTIDYATFEYEIEFMPDCRCGAAGCRGRIDGYRGLPPERRAAYGPYIAAYLPRMEAAPRGAAGGPQAA